LDHSATSDFSVVLTGSSSGLASPIQKQWWASLGFPVGLSGIGDFMRLSLQKAAHANMGGAAYRKFESPVFFVPRTPGFPVEVGGVVQLYAAFLERKPHTRFCLVLRNRKSGFAGANVGHPALG
jgi:hypothetical protein